MLLGFPDGHEIENNPIRLTIENIRTPRSFRPSSEFLIETMSVEGHVIDAGGTDIQVAMSQMNKMTAMSIQSLSPINGAITDYTMEIESFVELQDLDRLLITTPSAIGFSVDGISCEAADPPVGASEVTCESIDKQSLAVSLTKVDRKDGIFKFIVHGMKNPPNFRKTGLFRDIFMETYDYYDI